MTVRNTMAVQTILHYLTKPKLFFGVKIVSHVEKDDWAFLLHFNTEM